jgi:H+/Cl- antiporter ClcA/predicted transcriptional regulator
MNIWRTLFTKKEHEIASPKLGDFTVTPRVIVISVLAVCIGVIATAVAWLLLRLIGFFTNLLYYQRIDVAMTSPAGNHLGIYAMLVPISGALVVGIMARYGSERIRGHGIPEAIEAILMNGSRVAPRLAILKPISAALAIGSGGPFGAEGPIIMTGGAFGSIIAQFFDLTSAERKTLLVAGAAAGMAAVFATPVAAVLLGIELLLFEWKPRSAIPVALASATAGATRHYILGLGPLFKVPPHLAFIGPAGLVGCAVVGLSAGVLSIILTQAVYAAEDVYHRLPVHWMWWPAIGAVFIGIGGLIFPPALGVGYDVIEKLLQGNQAVPFLVGVLIVKSAIWTLSLSSGTSGGVVAPVLMTGAALGGLESLFLPHCGAGYWELVAMGATLAGAMSAPLTGVVFAFELTQDVSSTLPLLIACFFSFGLTTLTLKRSILTEKISRRGYHLSREYSLDPLEILFVKEVMRTNVVALPATATIEKARDLVRPTQRPHGQHLFPIIDDQRHVLGVISRNDLLKRFEESHNADCKRLMGDLAGNAVFAYPDEPLRMVVYRMVESGFTRMPVIEARGGNRLLGMIALDDLLRARTRSLEEERVRERVLRLRLPMGRRTESETVKIETDEESSVAKK